MSPEKKGEEESGAAPEQGLIEDRNFSSTRWIALICGPNKDFALEYQVLNWVLVTSAFMGILLTIENLMLRIPFPAAESTLVVTAASLFGYYIVRIKKRFSRMTSNDEYR